MRRGDRLPERDLLQPRSRFLLLLLQRTTKGSPRTAESSVGWRRIMAEKTRTEALVLWKLCCSGLWVVLDGPIRIAV